MNLSIAMRSLYCFKLRTSLAVLGVFLGTFSLILVSNLSGSLARKSELELEKLGKDLLIIRSGSVLRVGPNTKLLSEATNLTIEDARAIERSLPLVLRVSPSSHKNFPVRYGNRLLSSILVTGVTTDFPATRNFRVESGSFFSDEDDENLNRVAVLGTKIAEKLFGEESPIGKTVLIYRVPCRVIGIMEEKGVDVSNVDQDSQIFVPLQTFLKRFVNQTNVNTLYVQTQDRSAIPMVKGQIEALLRGRHGIKPNQKDDFSVIDLKDVVALKSKAIAMITVLGRTAATVSFLIGAMGILSIMILIVNERRGEIGIRRAVGSRKRDITLQFLLESSFISLLGGAAGVLFGFSASTLVFMLSGLPFTISPEGIAASFAASVAVGVAAGIYPSRKATSIQPVEVIRSI